MNRVILIGRLANDPELKYTPNNKSVCRFSLAVDRYDKQADFFDIVVWGQMGENCANYLGKGKQAAVDGKLSTRSYEAKDGHKVKVVEIIADSVQFLTPKEGKPF